MKKVLFIVLLLLDASGLIFAQTTGKIKGKVTDQQSSEAIPFANVGLIQNSKQILATTTDFDGNYVFDKVMHGNYIVEVASVGYQKNRVTGVVVGAGKEIQIDIKLNAAKELSAVEISVDAPSPLMDRATYSTVIVNEIKSLESASYSFGLKKNKAESGSYYNVSKEPDFSNESYDKVNYNEFQKVDNAPLSTFSIDVDRASYSNVRRFINQGYMPPKDAVRTEEMINYFSYNYPNPNGETPFSVITEVAQCPWNEKNKLVHIGIQGMKIETADLPPNNLVFLIDVSGSMSSDNKLGLVKKSLRLLVNQMREQDRIAMVVYAGAAGLVLPSTSGANKEKILSAIERLEAGGSTNGAGGINLAYETAKENLMKRGNNRVILATDGDFNVGVSSDNDLVTLIESKRNDGIFLTVLGYGMGNYKDSKMEKLADKGNGNYAYIDNLQEANKVLVKEMGGTLLTIAKDVKIQIEFNPAKVKSYRLVGYENRLLADKDFNDDTKDAGELGAGHTVTALYEIVPAGSNDDSDSPDIDPLKYQKKSVIENNDSSNEMLTVKLRYKDPKESSSKLISQVLKDQNKPWRETSDDFRFSAAVAQFGMILTDSKYKGKATMETTIEIAKKSKGADEDGYRAEFIRMLELANQLSMARKD